MKYIFLTVKQNIYQQIIFFNGSKKIDHVLLFKRKSETINE